MVEESPTLVGRLGSLELKPSQLAPYDRPIGLKQLYQAAATGEEHHLVRYPAGMRARWHRHTAAHTIVVLEGSLMANGQLLEGGAYCHFPGGQPMHHEPGPGGGCLFVILFHGPFDVEVIADRGDAERAAPEGVPSG
ncbi:MAG: cupin domain-containing protein, partial [Candidatus Dormibacteria bacterium]